MMKKNNLLEEDLQRRFLEICNYDVKNGINEMTLLGNVVGEEDDQEDDMNGGPQDGPDAGGAPAPGGDMGGGPNMPPQGGDTDGDMGGAPGGDMGGDTPPMDPNMGGGTPGAGPDAGAPQGGAQPPQGFNPQGDMSGEDFEGGTDTQQEGDEVIDVSELTDSQEDIEKEVEKIGGKFDKVMKALGAFEELLRANDNKIEDLKAEFERRNPTQIEKLSMQTAKSYPFNVTPEEFWKEKEATSNYSTEDDNNGKDQGQYVITANDVAGATDWKSIADSLEDDDFMYHQTLSKIMGL